MIQRAWRAAKAEIRLHMLSVFSVAVAFVCLSATLLVAFNIDAVRSKWSETGRASVYLDPDVEPKTIQTVRKALLAAEGVTKVEFVSSEQARAEVMGTTEDEAMASLPEEAFPASLEVTLTDDAAAARVERLATQLEALPAVEAVETYQAWGKRLDRLLSGGVQAAAILLLVVLAAVISVVGSTMRMALSRRRTEVEVLKMVGATDSYVRGPFVIEGAAQGGLGAFFAVTLMGILFLIVRDSFDGTLGTLLGASPQFLPILACLGLVALGATIGALSAYASLRRLIGDFAT
jgi:cell division transport system permease protein